MLAPVSSWAAAVASYVPDGFPGSRISMFLSQIPFNYYCILTLVMVIVTSLLNIDYGPMLKHEYNAQVKDDLFTTPERPSPARMTTRKARRSPPSSICSSP